MSNPDNTSISFDSLAVSTPLGIFFFLVTILLFMFRSSIGPFKLVLWIGLPLTVYIICSCVNLLTQYMNCRKIDAGKAFLGGLPSLGTVLLGLGLASISYCRIPIASVFAPLMIGKSVDVTKKNSTTTINSLKNSTSKECCTQKITLESIEAQYSIIAGAGYGFYVMFAVLFGLTIGNGIAAIC